MKRQSIIVALIAASAMLGTLAGCHADPDDVEGQAGELNDRVRRENAIGNLNRLYTRALAQANGDRSAAGPQAVADGCVVALTDTYVNNPDDRLNGRLILDLLVEMRDPRSLPALIQAMNWRPEQTEQHAIQSARALQYIDIPDDKKQEVINAIAQALSRVRGSRGTDNQMRITFLRALGNMGDSRATEVLTEIATRQSEDQNFLINRLAAEQVGRLRDPAAVPAMMKGLFLFAPNNPAMRMNDIAAEALVQIGRPALQPLLDCLNDGYPEGEAIARQYIAAIRQRDEAAASQMDAGQIVTNECSFALGQLGFREAIDPLIRLTQISAEEQPGRDEELAPQVTGRVMGAAIALVSINREESDTARIREALTTTYNAIPKQPRMQLIVALQHFMDPGVLPFLLTVSRTPEEELPDIRVLAVRAYSMLANRQEAAAMTALIAAEPGPEDGGYRTNFQENNPALEAATECNDNLECWIGKLGDENAIVARKAAVMIARYGRGNAQALEALVGQLGHNDTSVRGDVLYALDFAATDGSTAAVERIERIRETEDGRSSWNEIKTVAMSVLARLRSRTSSASAE